MKIFKIENPERFLSDLKIFNLLSTILLVILLLIFITFNYFLIPFCIAAIIFNVIAYNSLKNEDYQKGLKINYKIIFPIHIAVFVVITIFLGLYFMWSFKYGGLYLAVFMVYFIFDALSFFLIPKALIVYINRDSLRESLKTSSKKCFFCFSDLVYPYNFCINCGKEQNVDTYLPE